MQFFIDLPVAGIKAAITDHFIMLFGDMPDQPLYEFHNRDSLFYILIIFVPVVMEGDKVTIIIVNSGSGDDGPSKIASNVFHSCFWVAFVWLCINIEPFLVFAVTAGLDFLKGGAESVFHFVKKGGAKGIAQERIIKVLDVAPESVIAVTAFRNKAVDMRVPF